MGLNIRGKVEKINGKELSYSEFVERYLGRNEPVVVTGLMDGWRASKDWVTQNGQPNLSFFSTHFGKSKVQVAVCGKREFTDQKRVEMSVSEFINHWHELSARNSSDSSSYKGDDQSSLYLKDWHFVKEYPVYVAYTTPLIFSDDWLNLYLDSHSMHIDPATCHVSSEIDCSDYRFVYMGAKGTWTPLHADVFQSYSWSANVCGKKQWYFLSPSQCQLLFDRNMKNSVYDIFDNVSETNFPGFKKTVWLECTQERNEIIFVPSGWYHQVLNMEDTISINHNWFNAYNLAWVWNLLLKDYKEAKEYIKDVQDICDDFEGLCQRNLAANTGMNFVDFFVFISRFSFANLTLLYHLGRNEDPGCILSEKARRLIFNLMSIHKVAFDMKSFEVFAGEKLHGYLKNQYAAFSDSRKVFEESEFIELCTALGRTYRSIDQQQNQDSKTDCTSIGAKNKFLYLDFMEAIGSKVSGPEDLIRTIDHAVKNLSCMDIDLNSCLLSELNELKIFNGSIAD